MRRIELVERKGDTAVIMIEEKTKHNTKYTLECVNRIISIYYYLTICYCIVIYFIKGNFTVTVTAGFFIVLALLFLSGEGLRRRKVWGRSLALFTGLLIILPKVLRAIIFGHAIVAGNILIVYIFSSLSIYFIVSMIKEASNKGGKKLTKICVHCCTKLDIDAKVCSYCGRELSEEDTRAI